MESPSLWVPLNGLLFFRRCSGLSVFLSKWYNVNNPNLDLMFPWEQTALHDLMNEDPWIQKSILLLYKRQYDLPTAPTAFEHVLNPEDDKEEQLVFHFSAGKHAKILLVESSFGFDVGMAKNDDLIPPSILNFYYDLGRNISIVNFNATEAERTLQLLNQTKYLFD